MKLYGLKMSNWQKLDEKLGQDTYIHMQVCVCMGNQGKKAVGVIVFFVSFLEKTCQVDIVNAGICVFCVKRVVQNYCVYI
jgi:hypothetical protein